MCGLLQPQEVGNMQASTWYQLLAPLLACIFLEKVLLKFYIQIVQTHRNPCKHEITVSLYTYY
jgi:hypothetical protein